MSDQFDRVTMPKEIIRRIAEHEVLLSFYDDEAALAFREWWDDEGSILFKKFCGEREG